MLNGVTNFNEGFCPPKVKIAPFKDVKVIVPLFSLYSKLIGLSPVESKRKDILVGV